MTVWRRWGPGIYRELSRAGNNVYIQTYYPEYWTYRTVVCVTPEVWDACPEYTRSA